MSATLTPKVLVVGGGPGGYVAAIRAGQLGLETVLVEADRLGGTCLIRGCIPSKALIHAADACETITSATRGGALGISVEGRVRIDFDKTVAWKDGIVSRLSGGVAGLLKRAGVRVVSGWASFEDARTCAVAQANGAGAVRIKAEHVILATGSVPVELPTLPFGGDVISSTEALSLSAPPTNLAVVGAGYIGLELGTAFAKLGSSVTVVEAQGRILPGYDAEIAQALARALAKRGVKIVTDAKASGYEGGVLMAATAGGQPMAIPADKVLVAVGRAPRTAGWGIERMGVKLERGFVAVDDQCRTSVANVWAIGDLVGEPLLAHKASAQGEMTAEIIAGRKRRFDPVAIPAICYTDPEIVTVGDVQQGEDRMVASFPLAANGRALTLDGGEGFVRVVAARADQRVLGLAAVGRHVSELAGEFTALLEMGAVLQDVARLVHAHPTQSEAVGEAAMRALGHAIHI